MLPPSPGPPRCFTVGAGRSSHPNFSCKRDRSVSQGLGPRPGLGERRDRRHIDRGSGPVHPPAGRLGRRQDGVGVGAGAGRGASGAGAERAGGGGGGKPLPPTEPPSPGRGCLWRLPSPGPLTREGTRASGTDRAGAGAGAASAQSTARTEPGAGVRASAVRPRSARGSGETGPASCARRPEAVTQRPGGRCGSRQRGSGRLARRGPSTPGLGGGRAQRRVRSRRRWGGRRGAGSPPGPAWAGPTRGPSTPAVGAAGLRLRP